MVIFKESEYLLINHTKTVPSIKSQIRVASAFKIKLLILNNDTGSDDVTVETSQAN